MKVVLFDIDGVLNHITCKDCCTMDDYNTDFFPELVETLNQITKSTGAKLVCSSTWRWGRTVPQLKDLCVSSGITGELIGKTPWLCELDEERSQNHERPVPRSLCIDYWLQENNPSKYVILDDMALSSRWIDGHFIHVDNSVGLSPLDMIEAIKILRQD